MAPAYDNWHKLRRQAGHTGLLFPIGRENQPSFTIEHPDTIDALFVCDHAHDLVGGPAVVVEHGMPGGARDAARELIRTEDHGFSNCFFWVRKLRYPLTPLIATIRMVSDRISLGPSFRGMVGPGSSHACSARQQTTETDPREIVSSRLATGVEGDSDCQRADQ